jgi:hypothetical protein
MLLDGAAGQVRDAHLAPVRSNIRKIGEALAAIFEVQAAIYKQAPELQLEPKYEEPPEEISLANRRLGEAMLAADDLADQGKLAEARILLLRFAESEPLPEYKELALRQVQRYADAENA